MSYFKKIKFRKQIQYVNENWHTGVVDDQILTIAEQMGFIKSNLRSKLLVCKEAEQYFSKEIVSYMKMVVMSASYNDNDVFNIYLDTNVTYSEIKDFCAVKRVDPIEFSNDILFSKPTNIIQSICQIIHDTYSSLNKDLSKHIYSEYKLYDIPASVVIPYVNVFIRKIPLDNYLEDVSHLHDGGMITNDDMERLTATHEQRPWVKFQVIVDPVNPDDWEFDVQYNDIFVRAIIDKLQLDNVDDDGNEISFEELSADALDIWTSKNFARIVAGSLVDDSGHTFRPQMASTPESAIIENLEIEKPDDLPEEDFKQVLDVIKNRNSYR